MQMKGKGKGGSTCFNAVPSSKPKIIDNLVDFIFSKPPWG